MEVGDLLSHVWGEQHPSGHPGDEGSGKGSERERYLPRETK